MITLTVCGGLWLKSMTLQEVGIIAAIVIPLAGFIHLLYRAMKTETRTLTSEKDIAAKVLDKLREDFQNAVTKLEGVTTEAIAFIKVDFTKELDVLRSDIVNTNTSIEVIKVKVQVFWEGWSRQAAESLHQQAVLLHHPSSEFAERDILIEALMENKITAAQVEKLAGFLVQTSAGDVTQSLEADLAGRLLLGLRMRYPDLAIGLPGQGPKE